MRFYGICLALVLTFAAIGAEAAPLTQHTPSPPYFLVHVLF